MATEKYYLQRKESGYWGNSPVWWAKNAQGYTAYLNFAEKFCEEEALRMVKQDPQKWAAYKCSEIDRRTHRIFDHQDFKRLKQDPKNETTPAWGVGRNYEPTLEELKSRVAELESGYAGAVRELHGLRGALNVGDSQENCQHLQLLKKGGTHV